MQAQTIKKINKKAHNSFVPATSCKNIYVFLVEKADLISTA